MSHVDGNVLAGPLSELFSVDVTTATALCENCGDESVLARAMVYESGADLVVRCSGCDAVLLTLVRSPSDLRVEMRGLRLLRIPT
jgi:hypothetical protein